MGCSLEARAASQLCSHPPARLQGQGYAHWFKALDHTAQMLWDFRKSAAEATVYFL